MGDERYSILKRIGAVITAIALWYLSIRFSVAGFNIKIPDMAWAGIILGLSVTVIELIFTSENRGRNITIVLLGGVAYIYGVWSNIVGINAARGVNELSPAFLLSVILGLILEIAPEPLFLWGILGTETLEGDVVSAVSRIWSDSQKRPVGRPKQSKFGYNPDISTKSKVKPDTVSKSDPYLAMSRLGIVSSLTAGGRLIWDKNKTQSPVLYGNGKSVAVSRSLIRQMVTDRALIEKKQGDMIIEYILSGSEPPIKPVFV